MYQLTQHKFWGVLALIISIMFVAFMVTGCGGDDDDDDATGADGTGTGDGGGAVEAPPATSVQATPAGGIVPSTQSFQLTFDNGVKSATVNGTAATGAGTSWTASPPLTQGAGQMLTVDWVNRDDSTGTQQIGPYEVSDPDTTPPALQSGTVADNQNDVDPAAVNVSGLTFTFDEDINGTIKLTDEAGADLNWAGAVSGTSATLTVIAGQELANETTYKVEIDVTDGSNNPTKMTITFVTKPKE